MDRPADSKPFVYLPLVGARAGEAGGFAMIDAEDEELVKFLGRGIGPICSPVSTGNRPPATSGWWRVTRYTRGYGYTTS